MSAGLTEGNATDTQTGSAGALNADVIASVDVNDYQSCNLQVTGTFVATLKVQGSNDNSNFFDAVILDASNPFTPPTNTITAPGIFYSPTPYRYFRLRITTYTSGTATGLAFFQRMPSGDLGARVATLRGATDGTRIGNTGDQLKVAASLSSGQLVPTITNKIRMRLNTSNVTVVAVYTSLFNRSGTGLFFGFQTAFNSSNVRIKLTIDGGVVFENTLAEFQNFEINDTSTTRVQMGGFLTTVGNVLDFSSRYAIPYSSSVDISVQRSDGSNHVNNNWIVFLTEDT